MIDTFQEVMQRKEVRQLLRLEEEQSATLAQSFIALLLTLWGLLNDATAKQARRCKIDLHLFG